MKRLLLLIACCWLLSGCASVPFQETTRVPLTGSDPRGAVAQFQSKVPEQFQLVNTVEFEYLWRSFLGMGYLDVDRRAGTFKVVCMNPIGVPLFQLSGDRTSLESGGALLQLPEFKELPATVGNDIRRMYFDLVPSADAYSFKGKYEMGFRQESGAGALEYTYAGAERDLVEKAYYQDGALKWRVSYYEYREAGGKRYPQGIVLANYQYGYRLIVRQKELY